ncbi:MFS transporter [Labedaea rhizosphaerae]|uniref:Putative MFS family arabinose efflux permease n=1 Tax=Labedaea rhizosphaerae TaxID=598644 RepID=A0A4R6S2S0_LABRH|nr:MFS transporter [Labedaea rhizosphaerae]TDP92946.1 putative MFS family arabinose efflux permease [Labedaea rhizosphaerae]
MAQQVARRTTFREVLAVPEFRWMWLAELLSVCGDQLARVALSVLVFDRTGSAFLTGLTYALTYAPSLLGGILFSGLADRFPRRAVLVGVDVWRAALMAVVAVPGVPMWSMGLLVAGVSMANPLAKSAQLALLPQVLPDEGFVVGMALRNVTIQSAQLAGFAGGGLLVAALSPRASLALDAATFVCSALLLRCGLADRPAAGGAAQSMGARLRAGARLAFAAAAPRTLISFTWLAGLLPVYEGLAAPYAASLGGGSTAVGLILAADPLGSVIGALVFARCVPERHRAGLIGPLTVLSAVPLLGCLLHPGLAVSIVLFVVTGGLGTAALMQATASLMLAAPDESRGQLMGLSNAGLTTVMGVAPFAAGALATWLGAPNTVAVVGLAGLVLAVPLTVVWQRVRPTMAVVEG